MITEHQQELACLYALGALPDQEAKAFASALDADEELQRFTRRLGEVTIGLALSTTACEPPPDLKRKVLAAVARSEHAVRPDFRSVDSSAMSWLRWMPWAAAACLTFACVALYQQNITLKRDGALSTNLSAEQRRQLASLHIELADLQTRDRVSQMRIAMLGSLLEGSPKAVAVSLWDVERQDGVLVVQNLAPQPADKDYQLWVIDPQHGSPVDAGVFTVDEKGNVRFRFKPKVSVKSADKFAVTLEKKGGVPAPQGQMVLAGSWL